MSTYVNPFEILTRSISSSQSIVLAVMYGILGVALLFRFLTKMRKYKPMYFLLILCCAVRVATFAVRYEVAVTPANESNFQLLLIASGILVVAGLLLVAEAVLKLLFQWSYVVRGRDLGVFTTFVSPLQHLVLLTFSAFGIVGAVLQIVAINKLDFAMFDTAKQLRIVSGALFIFLSAMVILAPTGLVIFYRNRLQYSEQRVVLPAALVTLCGSCLMLESVYRVLAAIKVDGFILETYSVGLLLVLPEFIIILVFILFDFDTLAKVVLYGTQSNTEESIELGPPSTTPSKTSRNASEV